MWGFTKPSADTQQWLIDALRQQLTAKDVQIAELQRQIGMVLESKFETVHRSDTTPDNSVGLGFPAESLLDVNAYDDEEFLEKLAL